MFELDAQLQSDTYKVGEWPLSILLMHRDSNFPWFILVPKRAGVSEIYDLNEADQLLLLAESRRLANAIGEIFRPDKLNVAALGNVVNQLHVHHIARFVSDPVWPKPVWGAIAEQAYDDETLRTRIASLRRELGRSQLGGFELSWSADAAP